MHCAVHEIMGSRNLTGGKKGCESSQKRCENRIFLNLLNPLTGVDPAS